ncbi:actin cytoskeleton-regulatory complex protein SLA1, putative [Rhizoctonia solani AG-3 Rhs1AP]|uniref:Actin cytoskeleton-regulatory complex protein SLA1 n=1 Tax=Rhizoctonia solani AG-3 Rhs1AP TaxID=1086054 RepID=X8IVX3_9AGAM|nr:actin cytoskeleton-regulatory complex protein SLA1, putative [Rhizoctonia solani AG-3 Rhs1AP]
MTVSYHSVLVALYDYNPPAGAEDEVAVKEDQVLLLLDNSDDEWWKVKIKTNSQEDNGDSGLVPKAYVEDAKPISSAKALYDYAASGDGELTISEDEDLLIYDQEAEWTLVKSTKSGGKAGYVPATYIEPTGSAQEEEEESVAPVASPPVPAAAPRTSYSDPTELVAASHTKARNDPVETWSVSIIDKKDKKKKGTLGVGNGAIFFSSESDKTPVQQWQTSAVATVTSEKAKHVDIQIATGSDVTTLRFVANSRDVSDAILEKVEASRLIATSGSGSGSGSGSTPTAHVPDPINTEIAKQHKNASVRFAKSPDSVIPNDDDDDDEGPFGEQASALYDFTAQAADELSVKEGETLIVINREESEEWWKCRNMKGEEGVVPSSYVELQAGSAPGRSQSQDDDDDTTAELATSNAAEQQAAEQRRMVQIKEREEAERRAADEKRRKREQERAEAEARARELERLEKERTAKQAARSSTGPRPSTDSEPRRSNVGPRPGKTRVWHDRTGQFKVEAEFLGIENGKIKLHKTNGVIIDVPSAKMSPEDMAYVDKFISAGKRPATTPDDDNVPLSLIADRRNSRPPPAAPRPVPQQPKKPQIDWFDFFLGAGCDMDDCTRYAASFNRDKIDESIVSEIKESTLRSLGLREGDIIRVMKAIEKKGWKPEDDSARREQLRKDEELARQLQAQENAASPRRSATTSPAPNLFAGPNGQLKSTRRGRPPPSSKTAPIAVDATALGTGSISRGGTPQITSPAGGVLTSSPTATHEERPASAAPVLAPVASGFDDDAWTPRPSSAKPASPGPALALSPPPAPAPPVPAPPPPAPAPAPAPAPVVAPVAPTPPPAPPAPIASPPIQRPATTNPATATISQPASTQFDILAKIQQMRPPSAPIVSQPTGFQSPGTVPMSFQSGLGMGNSVAPIGQLLTAQQTGLLGPRGPPAPVPSNQSLLTPLVPTNSGFNAFVPTRPGSTPSFGGLQSQPTGFQPMQPSFLQSQPTGFQPSQQPSFLQSQPTGFQPSFLPSQPTGFQPSQPSFMQSQPTGFQPSQPSFMQTGFSPMAPQSPPLVMQPTGMGGMFNGGGFQSQPQQNSFNSPPSTAPPQNNLSAANVFASMKAGTFVAGGAGDPQPSDKYDALRQPTGGNFMAPQQTGFGFPQNQFQPGFNGYR